MTAPKPGQASFVIHWLGGDKELPVQYNPTELQIEKQAQYAEVNIPGLSAPLQQFVRGNAATLTLELFFDTSDTGTGLSAKPVTELTDQVLATTLIEPTGHTPPPVTFKWGPDFPRNHLPDAQTKQKCNWFKGIVTSLRQTITFWSRGGVPLRSKLNLTIREFATLKEQLDQLNLSSPDRTHGHVLGEGEALHRLAHQYYRQSDQWRRIALDNGIEDPRRLNAGKGLRIPRIPTLGEVG